MQNVYDIEDITVSVSQEKKLKVIRFRVVSNSMLSRFTVPTNSNKNLLEHITLFLSETMVCMTLLLDVHQTAHSEGIPLPTIGSSSTVHLLERVKNVAKPCKVALLEN